MTQEYNYENVKKGASFPKVEFEVVNIVDGAAGPAVNLIGCTITNTFTKGAESHTLTVGDGLIMVDGAAGRFDTDHSKVVDWSAGLWKHSAKFDFGGGHVEYYFEGQIIVE